MAKRHNSVKALCKSLRTGFRSTFQRLGWIFLSPLRCICNTVWLFGPLPPPRSITAWKICENLLGSVKIGNTAMRVRQMAISRGRFVNKKPALPRVRRLNGWSSWTSSVLRIWLKPDVLWWAVHLGVQASLVTRDTLPHSLSPLLLVPKVIEAHSSVFEATNPWQPNEFVW